MADLGGPNIITSVLITERPGEKMIREREGDATMQAEDRAMWGQEPRNAGPFKELEKTKKWNIPWCLQKEHRPSDTLPLA